jgi:hypothetical protein
MPINYLQLTTRRMGKTGVKIILFVYMDRNKRRSILRLRIIKLFRTCSLMAMHTKTWRVLQLQGMRTQLFSI